MKGSFLRPLFPQVPLTSVGQLSVNPYKQNAASDQSDQGLHCLLTGISI